MDNASKLNSTIKIAVLFVLCFQNSGHALLTRYSQGVLHEKYSSSEVVFVGEMIKFLFSGTLVTLESTEGFTNSAKRLLFLLLNSHKVIILAAGYMVSNLLSYFALARVDAASYTVCLQLKVLTTAAFSKLILNKKFTYTQWRALLLLVIGCVLVASPSFNDSLPTSEITTKSDSSDIILGFGALLVMVSISGFSAVYFESILKDERDRCSIWERNFQLSAFSMLLIALYSFGENNLSVMSGSQNHGTSYFVGWTVNTVLICTLQASGGLLVAATLKYADAIIKTLVTAFSIVLSTIFGHYLLGGELNMFVALGCITVIISIFNYVFQEH